MERYLKTDLACELYKDKTLEFNRIDLFGYEAFETRRHLRNTSKIEKSLTLCVGNSWKFCKKEELSITNALCELITHLLSEDKISYKSVLVVGVGNKSITADALGPMVIEKMIPTAQLESTNNAVYLLAPGALGQTGFEISELINAIITSYSVDCVIVIDSLSTSSFDRLGTTIQISNYGIKPGSGNGNERKEISKEALGVPVYSIGVPLAINASAFLSSTLLDAGFDEPSTELKALMDYFSSEYLSPKDLDLILRSVSKIIASALSMSLGIENIFPMS